MNIKLIFHQLKIIDYFYIFMYNMFVKQNTGKTL